MKFYKIVKSGKVNMDKANSNLYKAWKANGQVVSEKDNVVTFEQTKGSDKAVVIVFNK